MSTTIRNLNDQLKTRLHSSPNPRLRTTTRVIGLLQVTDTQINRFEETDITLLDLLLPWWQCLLLHPAQHRDQGKGTSSSDT
jgi:hypothetical protein